MNREPERNPRKALGKGLSALLPARGAGPAPVVVLEEQKTSSGSPRPRHDLPENFEQFQNIPIDRILPNEEQPRDSFDVDKINELAQSIRANGLIQPITVYRTQAGNYRIIAGERRWRAAQIAGLNEIPALVRTVEQHQLLELALVENIQREDLNPIEIATAFQRLATQHGLTHEQIAERTGKDRSTITNFTRLLKLSPFVRSELAMGRISMGHGRALLNIGEEKEQLRVCNEIVDKQLSVRETEALVKDLTSFVKGTEAGEKASAAAKPALDPNVRAALDEMAMALGTRVRLVPKSPTSGRIEIEYYSQDDLDRIYSVIVKQ